jgi:hypothetical protein
MTWLFIVALVTGIDIGIQLAQDVLTERKP